MEKENLYVRLPEWTRFGFVAVREGYVNIDDLIHMKPGSIVRVADINAIKVFPPMDFSAEFAAGMISEDV